MSYLTTKVKLKFILYTVKFLCKKPMQAPHALKNLIKALYLYYKNRDSVVSEYEYNDRLSKCYHCDRFNKKDLACEECGCFIPVKALLPREQCPLLYWLILAKDPADIVRVRVIAELEQLARTRRKEGE